MKPLDVPCSRCGAESGKGCRAMGPHDEAWFGGHHLQRDVDALTASNAVKALLDSNS